MPHFYFPLRLGIPRPKPVRRPDEDGPPGGARDLAAYEAWREGVGRFEHEYEEHPEAEVLAALRDGPAAPSRRLWLIHGEPGAGKTTLVNEWFRRWTGEIAALRLGLPVPVIVRLRELTADDLKSRGDALAQGLWRRRVMAGADLPDPSARIYRDGGGERFRPVWLLDGLDEVPPELLSEGLYEALAGLPGRKIVTCRTAVCESQRRAASPYMDREYQVLGLGPAEQETFLTGALDGDAAAAAALHANLRANPQLRPLAGNPLMLQLIADASRRIALPATRADFYRESIEAMWHDKLHDDPEAFDLPGERDGLLVALAADMGMAAIEAPLRALNASAKAVAGAESAALRRAVERSGLLKVDRRRATFAFVHLTFQEYCLALALKDSGLQPALEAHWHDARYEETLGLLVSILAADDRFDEIDRSMAWLIDHGRRLRRDSPEELLTLGRSPMRTALHVLNRAGVGLARLPETWSAVSAQFDPTWPGREASGLAVASFKLAIAVDVRSPSEALAALARDLDPDVRLGAAGNPRTPPTALADIARDPVERVRGGAAGNPQTPPESLADLAHDPDADVRRRAAGNPQTPPEALADLTREPDESVRWVAAGNPRTPPEALADLAREPDESEFVRGRVAGNPQTPPEVLIALARDPTKDVRLGAVGNPQLPLEIVAALARDPAENVRRVAAGNSQLPLEVLDALARDPAENVRMWAAANPQLPLEVLAILASDRDESVRRRVAANPQTPTAVLANLALDLNDYVRFAAAGNPRTPPEALADLARDRDREPYVRQGAAWNPQTPPGALADLARIPDENVREGAAGNPRTPPAALADLARDPAERVRGRAAGNLHTPPELLAALARDPAEEVRLEAARNPQTPPELLAALARDPAEDVRWRVARNPQLLLEWL